MDLGSTTLDSPYGVLGLTWRPTAERQRVTRIYLPNQWAALIAAGGVAPALTTLPPDIAALTERIARFLEGEAVTLSVELLALEQCSAFQQRVLLAEHGVPRGQVTTYGRLAAHVGVPKGARAAGSALAHNPFPIVIPCHRAIASDGGLGGFQGGLQMKRRLLEAEGVTVSDGGRVLGARWQY